MSFLNRESAARSGRISWLVRGMLLVFFLWLAGRYWNPYHGFTKLLQFEPATAATMLPALRAAPIYVHRDGGGYDGQFYAQLAASPALRDPGLPAAIDNLGYRARRMLLSWTAWVVGLGDPVAAVRAYAWLNLALWFALAAVLWRLFPVGEWCATVAWAGLLFAAGTLHSVRFALTDLTAVLLIAGALCQLERGGNKFALVSLSLSALARETSVLAAAALLPEKTASRGDWWRAAARGLLILLPLLGWMIYLQTTVGWPAAGQRNFSWPLVGLAEKWCEAVIGLELESDPWLAISGLLVPLALTVQLLYLVIRPRPNDPWWRLGAAYAVLLLFLGPAVWVGTSGAAARVLLPLTLAFNVLGVRARAGALWLILGNLTVLNGILSLWTVPYNPGDLTTRWTWNHDYLLETDRRWYTTESRHAVRWAWCSQDGRLILRSWPQQDRVKVQLHLQGFTARDLEIRHRGKIVWQGQLGNRLQWVQLPELPAENGILILELHSNTPPHSGGPQSDGRELGFVCYGFKLE